MTFFLFIFQIFLKLIAWYDSLFDQSHQFYIILWICTYVQACICCLYTSYDQSQCAYLDFPQWCTVIWNKSSLFGLLCIKHERESSIHTLFIHNPQLKDNWLLGSIVCEILQNLPSRQALWWLTLISFLREPKRLAFVSDCWQGLPQDQFAALCIPTGGLNISSISISMSA